MNDSSMSDEELLLAAKVTINERQANISSLKDTSPDSPPSQPKTISAGG